MKTCLYKYAAGGDVARSPGKLLNQWIQCIIGIQDKLNLLPHSLLTHPKNSTCFINTVYVENLGYSHATRGKLRQRQWEVITDLRSEQLGLLCARPVFRLSGQQFFKQNWLCLCIKSPFPHQKKRQLFPTDSLWSLGEQGNRKKTSVLHSQSLLYTSPAAALLFPAIPRFQESLLQEIAAWF